MPTADPTEQIIDGLTHFAEFLNDLKMAQAGAMLYKSLQPAFAETMSPADTCRLAFPSMIIRPDLRAQCFVAILEDRMIVAWKQGGLFRKTVEHDVIATASITDAQRQAGSGSTRDANLLRIQADHDVTLALPVGGHDVTGLVRTALHLP